jgi:hypothetical protein
MRMAGVGRMYKLMTVPDHMLRGKRGCLVDKDKFLGKEYEGIIFTNLQKLGSLSKCTDCCGCASCCVDNCSWMGIEGIEKVSENGSEVRAIGPDTVNSQKSNQQGSLLPPAPAV